MVPLILGNPQVAYPFDPGDLVAPQVALCGLLAYCFRLHCPEGLRTQIIGF